MNETNYTIIKRSKNFTIKYTNQSLEIRKHYIRKFWYVKEDYTLQYIIIYIIYL